MGNGKWLELGFWGDGLIPVTGMKNKHMNGDFRWSSGRV